jgi:uncharacterized small protein (DUF1192 family)
MSHEAEKVLKEMEEKLRKTLDEYFKPYEEFDNQLSKSAERLLDIAKEIEHMFKYRLKDVTSVKDLELLASLIGALVSHQLDTIKFQHRLLLEFKEIVLYLSCLPSLQIVEFAKLTFPSLSERLKAFEDEIKRLKEERKEIEITVPKEYEEAMKEITRLIEERKKKEGTMVV